MSDSKVLGISCRLTGTDDYHYSDCEECKSCSYSKMCQAKFDEDALDIAYESLLEGEKLIEEGQAAINYARTIFKQQMDVNDLTKYQHKHLVISNIYIKESVTYPKAKLLKTFTLEQLAPASETKPAYWQVRINDLLKQKKDADI